MTSRTIQLLLIMMASLATISATDIFLPSLPHMATYFGTSEGMTQLSIPLYLLGSLLAAPVLGSLSDYFGRRHILLFGLTLFLFGTIICTYSFSLAFFLGGRFVQGSGAIVAPVVGWAMIQDLYPADMSAKVMSWVGSVASCAIFVAPAVGGYIHISFGWQGNFLVIGLFTALTLILMLFLKPKMKVSLQKEKLLPMQTLKIYIRILKNKNFLFYISFFALLSCGEYCYLTLIPFYFENSLFLSPDVFGLYLSCSASFYILGTFLTPMILSQLGVDKTLGVGIVLALVGSSFLLCVSFFSPTSPILIVMAFGIYILGAAIIWGPSTSRALQSYEDIRGAASAVRSLILTASFAGGGFVGSFLNDTYLIPLAFFLLAMATGCIIIFQRLIKFEPL